MRIKIYNNRTQKTTIKNIPFYHKDFAENEEVFLQIYYEQLTDVLASAIFAHRHDGSYTNLNSLNQLSHKLVTFLKSAAKKQYRYEYWYPLVRVSEFIASTTNCILTTDLLYFLFNGDKEAYRIYIEEQYDSLWDVLTHRLPTCKKGV